MCTKGSQTDSTPWHKAETSKPFPEKVGLAVPPCMPTDVTQRSHRGRRPRACVTLWASAWSSRLTVPISKMWLKTTTELYVVGAEKAIHMGILESLMLARHHDRDQLSEQGPSLHSTSVGYMLGGLPHSPPLQRHCREVSIWSPLPDEDTETHRRRVNYPDIQPAGGLARVTPQVLPMPKPCPEPLVYYLCIFESQNKGNAC